MNCQGSNCLETPKPTQKKAGKWGFFPVSWPLYCGVSHRTPLAATQAYAVLREVTAENNLVVREYIGIYSAVDVDPSGE